MKRSLSLSSNALLDNIATTLHGAKRVTCVEPWWNSVFQNTGPAWRVQRSNESSPVNCRLLRNYQLHLITSELEGVRTTYVKQTSS